MVWLANRTQALAAPQVALKFPMDDDVDKEQIIREADLWVKAGGHPNVLPIIEAQEYGDQIIIASEYIHEGTLEDWLKNLPSGKPNVGTAINLTLGILAGLEHLHSKGIIHRDLKPANILLQGLLPRLADFGIARTLKTSNLYTNVAGTLAYMAPELFGARPKLTVQSDLWAAGVIFYKLLTGHLPFPQSDMGALVEAIRNRQPSPLPNSISPHLKEFLRRSLLKDPSQRYQSAKEMRLALQNAVDLMNAPPVPKPKPYSAFNVLIILLACGLVSLLIVLSGVLYTTAESERNKKAEAQKQKEAAEQSLLKERENREQAEQRATDAVQAKNQAEKRVKELEELAQIEQARREGKKVWQIVQLDNYTDNNISFSYTEEDGSWTRTIVKPGEGWVFWIEKGDLIVKYDYSFDKGYQEKTIKLTPKYVIGNKPDESEAKINYFELNEKGEIEIKCCL